MAQRTDRTVTAALLFAITASASALESGSWIPLDSAAGLLACPQSRTAQEHLGDCVGISPLGSAATRPGSAAPDLFAQCEAQRIGLPARGGRWGSSMLYRYPFLSRDASSGAPLFGAPVPLLQDSVLPGNISLADLRNKVVWQGGNGTRAFAAVFSSDLVHVLELNGSDGWRYINASRFTLPAGLGQHGLSSVAVLPPAEADAPGEDGCWAGLTAVGVVQTGNSSRSHALFAGHGDDWRSTNYRPYGGDGIYLGTLGLHGVVAFDFDIGCGEEAATGGARNYRALTPPDWSGGIMGLQVAVLRLGGRPFAACTSRAGLVFTVPIISSANASGSKPLPLPRVAVDSGTESLFYARVIGSKPIAYPGASGSENDDMLLGGENALYFARVAAARAAGNGASRRHGRPLRQQWPPLLNLFPAGPALQQGAALVTGQTPTVSTGDWDGDGLVDIIAGTSEGRILFAKRASATGGFLPPQPLIVGEDAETAELLVQGGYRRDIQGPTESRWGYTAPFAFDWNGDGLLDVLSSDNSALTTVYLRSRATATGRLSLRRGVPLRLDGLELHGTWRNGPAAAQVGNDVVLVTSDEQDEVHLYYRVDSFNLRDGGKLHYREPRTNQLLPIGTNYLHAGGSGRLKYTLVDFDGDGLLDLLLGTCGYHAVPSNSSGLPACSGGACRDNGATVLLMRQAQPMAALGATAAPPPPSLSEQSIFEWPEWVTVQGKRLSFGGQEAGVAPLDAGDGELSLVVATPGGRHLFFAAADIGTATAEPMPW